MNDEIKANLKKMIEESYAVYTETVHVPRSGMSCEIKLYVALIEERNKKPYIQEITGQVARFLDKKLAKHDGIVVHGCGFDRHAALVNEWLSPKLYNKSYAIRQERI